jgi:hypothetical protein
MPKPFALRLTRLLFAGMDLFNSEPPKRLDGVPTESNGPLVGFVNNAGAHGGTRSWIVAYGTRGVYATECLGGPIAGREA